MPACRKARARELGIEFGVLKTGTHNAITDVKGLTVGQVTLKDDAIGMHTGVTAIVPHPNNIFKNKVPAGIFLANGFGKMAGFPQVKELGNIETPIVLTNDDVRSLNAVVGETNDGGINDIRSRFVKPEHVLKAIMEAKSGPVEEGPVGAGTGTKARS